MSEQNTNIKNVVGAFAIGAVIGAGLALLFAPQSGDETRKLISKRAGQIKNRLRDALDDAKELAQSKVDDLADALHSGDEGAHPKKRT